MCAIVHDNFVLVVWSGRSEFEMRGPKNPASKAAPHLYRNFLRGWGAVATIVDASARAQRCCKPRSVRSKWPGHDVKRTYNGTVK